MSGTSNPLASPPTTIQVVQNMLATMAAISGVVTDYNEGSQVRTMAEAQGSVIDLQGIANQQQALKALTYGTASAYGIQQDPAQPATGVELFCTAPGSGAFPSVITVSIPAGTIVGTQGGVQYLTTSPATLAQGATGVLVGISAQTGGTVGNTGSGTVTQLLSNLGAPLTVLNQGPIAGGLAAEAPSVTLARLAAKQGTFGLCSPYAIANACIGVTGTDGTVCKFAACYEPWIAQIASGGSGTAGFTVYIDDGSGGATAPLITAVGNTLMGNVALGESGYRPIGVPYSVSGVTPIFANVTVSGTILPIASLQQVENSVETQVVATMQQNAIGASVYQPILASVVSNSAQGYFTSLTVSLFLSGGTSPVTEIDIGPGNRVLLNNLIIDISTVTV